LVASVRTCLSRTVLHGGGAGASGALLSIFAMQSQLMPETRYSLIFMPVVRYAAPRRAVPARITPARWAHARVCSRSQVSFSAETAVKSAIAIHANGLALQTTGLYRSPLGHSCHLGERLRVAHERPGLP
jgi:hypothetical protein